VAPRADAGGACVNVNDTTADHSEVYFGRLEVVDGSETVYYPASSALPLIGMKRTTGSPLLLVFIGDSRIEGDAVRTAAQVLTRALDRPVVMFNRAKSGLRSVNWHNGYNAQIRLATTGSPSSGTAVININLGAGSLTNFYNIPHNCSAALLKTILEDNTGTYTNGNVNGSNNAGIGGAGNVTCTGGPLNVGAIVATFDGPTSSKKTVGSYGVAFNGFNTGSPVTSKVLEGGAADATYFTPMMAEVAQVLAEDTDITEVWVCCTIGTNDMNDEFSTTPEDYLARMQSAADAITALGYKFALMAPPIIRSGATYAGTKANIRSGQRYAEQLETMHNGTTVFYLGNHVQKMAILDAYGASDGLHGNTQEVADERYLTGMALAGAISPAASIGQALRQLLLSGVS
jgi:hypothetical protein